MPGTDDRRRDAGDTVEGPHPPLPNPLVILGVGARYTFGHPRLLIRFGLPLALLIAGAGTLMHDWGMAEDVLPIAGVTGLIIFSWFCHRRYLIGPHRVSVNRPVNERVQEDGSRGVWRTLVEFIWRAVLLTAVWLTAVILAGSIVDLLAGSDDDDMSAATKLTMASVGIVLTFVAARFLPMFGAISIGQRVSWAGAWRFSRGAGWRLALAFLFIGLAYVAVYYFWLYIVAEIEAQHPYDYAPVYLGAAVTDVIFTVLASSCSAFVYRDLESRQYRKAEFLENFD